MSKRYLLLSVGLLVVSIWAAACSANPIASASGDDTPAGEGEKDSPEAVSHGGEINDYVSVVDALRAEGAVVEPSDSVEQPFFEPAGQIISVDGADVQVFEFESVEAREEASATISPDGSSVGTSMMMWVDQPNFWAKGKIIALYVGSDQAVIDLLTGVLGAPLTTHNGS